MTDGDELRAVFDKFGEVAIKEGVSDEVAAQHQEHVVLATTLESLPNRGRYAATVARGAAAEDLTDQAEKYVRATVARSDLSGEHESWWSDYWTGSHIAIPDAALERQCDALQRRLGRVLT